MITGSRNDITSIRGTKEASTTRIAPTAKESMEQLHRSIESEGGLSLVPMWKLRDAIGKDKLGIQVVAGIAKMLDEHGMGTLPFGETLPIRQDVSIRVYAQRSGVGELVEAVIHPSGRGPRTLRDRGNDDAKTMLARVRSLVADDGS